MMNINDDNVIGQASVPSGTEGIPIELMTNRVVSTTDAQPPVGIHNHVVPDTEWTEGGIVVGMPSNGARKRFNRYVKALLTDGTGADTFTEFYFKNCDLAWTQVVLGNRQYNNSFFCPHNMMTYVDGPAIALWKKVCGYMGVSFGLDCCEDTIDSFVPKTLWNSKDVTSMMALRKAIDLIPVEDRAQIIRRDFGFLFENSDAHIVDMVWTPSGKQILQDKALKVAYELRGLADDLTDHGFRDCLLPLVLTGPFGFDFTGVADSFVQTMKSGWEWIKAMFSAIYESTVMTTMKNWWTMVTNPMESLYEKIKAKCLALGQMMSKKIAFGLMGAGALLFLYVTGFKAIKFIVGIGLSLLTSMGVTVPLGLAAWANGSERTDFSYARDDPVEEEIRNAILLFTYGEKNMASVVSRLNDICPNTPRKFLFLVSSIGMEGNASPRDLLSILSRWGTHNSEKLMPKDRDFLEMMKTQCLKEIGLQNSKNPSWKQERETFERARENSLMLQEFEENGFCYNCDEDGKPTENCYHVPQEKVTLTSASNSVAIGAMCGLTGALVQQKWMPQPEVKEMLTFFRLYGGMAAIGGGLCSIGMLIANLWPKVIAYAVSKQYFPEAIVNEKVHGYLRRAQIVIEASNSAAVLASPNYVRAVESLNAQSIELISKGHLDADQTRLVMSYQSKLLGLLPSCYCSDYILSGRDPPFTVHFYGLPGRGKTQILSRLRLAYGPKNCYMRRVGDGFWDGLNVSNSKVILWDEWLTGDTFSLQASETLSMCSGATFMPALASLDSAAIGIKGTEIAPSMVFLASNYGWPYINLPNYNAVYRRRNLLVEVEAADTKYLDVNGHVDLSKCSDEERNSLAYLKVRLRNPMTSEGPSGEWMSFVSFLKVMQEASENFKKFNTHLQNMTKSNAEMAFEAAWNAEETSIMRMTLTGPGVNSKVSKWVTDNGLVPTADCKGNTLQFRDKNNIEQMKGIFAAVNLDYTTLRPFITNEEGMKIAFESAQPNTKHGYLKTLCGFVDKRQIIAWGKLCKRIMTTSETTADDSDVSSTSSMHSVPSWDFARLDSFTNSQLTDMSAIDPPVDIADLRSYGAYLENVVNASVQRLPIDLTHNDYSILYHVWDRAEIVRTSIGRMMGVELHCRDSYFAKVKDARLKPSWPRNVPKYELALFKPTPFYGTQDPNMPENPDHIDILLKGLVASTAPTIVEPMVIPGWGQVVHVLPTFDFKSAVSKFIFGSALAVVVTAAYQYFRRGETEIPLTERETEEILGPFLTSKKAAKTAEGRNANNPGFRKPNFSKKLNANRIRFTGPKTIKKNVVEMSWEDSGSMYAIALGNGRFLSNLHFFGDKETGRFENFPDKKMRIRFANSEWTEGFVPNGQLVGSRDLDLAVFQFVTAKVGFKGNQKINMSEEFITDLELDNLNSFGVHIVDPLGATKAGFARLKHNVPPIADQQWIINPESVVFSDNIDMEIGECGKPWVITTGMHINKVVGIQMASSPARFSYGAIVTQEVVEKLLEELACVAKVEDQLDMRLTSNSAFEPNVTCSRKILPNESVFIPERTAFTVSPIYDELQTRGIEVKKAPAPLRSDDPRVEIDNDHIELMVLELKEVSNPDPDMTILAKIKRECKKDLDSKLLWPVAPHELNLDQAVAGIPGVLSSVRMNSSAGWPLVKTTSTSHGKRKHIRVTRDERNAHNVKAELSPELEAECLAYHEYLMRNGQKPDCRWLLFIKDELRSIEKVKQGRVRLTACGPLALWIHARKLCGTFMAAINASWTTTNYAVGCNPMSHDLDVILSRLSKMNVKMFDGDGKDWDKRLHRSFINAALEIIGEIMEKNDAHFKKEAYDKLCALILESPNQFKGELFGLHHGQRSGNIFTTVMNCIIHELYWRYTFAITCPNLKFEEHVALACCGDDIIVSINEETLPVFNDAVHAEEIARLGQIFTSSDKVSRLTGIPKEIEDITFLGCHPRKFYDRWFGALRKDSINDMLLWQKHADDNIQRWEAALRFMAGWGYKEFEIYLRIVRSAIEERLSKPIKGFERFQLVNFIRFIDEADHESLLQEIVSETTFSSYSWNSKWLL